MSQGKLAVAIAIKLEEIRQMKSAGKERHFEVEADLCEVAEKVCQIEARYDRVSPSAQWPKRRALKNLVLERRSRKSKRR